MPRPSTTDPRATLKAGEVIEYPLGVARKGYLVPAVGAVEINGVRIDHRDGAAISEEEAIKVKALEDAEKLFRAGGIEAGHGDAAIHLAEARGIPELGGEVAVGLHPSRAPFFEGRCPPK